MQKKIRFTFLLFSLILVCSLNGVAQSAKNWAQFRGPQGLGIAANDPALPVEFSEQQNLLWKTPVGKGNSSPCVWGNRIFLTAFAGKTLQTICFNTESGKQVWEQSVTVDKVERVHPINTPATPTAAADGERVYVYFGSYGLLCYDFSGKMIWETAPASAACQYVRDLFFSHPGRRPAGLFCGYEGRVLGRGGRS